MKIHPILATVLAVLGLGSLPTSALGQVIQDNFTGATVNYNWTPFLGACLTAGNNTGTIPACVGNSYYTEQLVGGSNANGILPDVAGAGALRFTNGAPGGYAQAGGIISGFTFPSGQGLQVTFTTVTYRGDSGGGGGDGADGISFFLSDGTKNSDDLGAFGGSLGYSCSNVNNDTKLHPITLLQRGYDGMRHAYLGLGIDEYGNFLNQGDNTATGLGYRWNRIGLRGAGDISWEALHNNPATAAYYPASLSWPQRHAAVRNACRTGFASDYTGDNYPDNTFYAAPPTTIALADYNQIPNAYQVLPNAVQIANEAALTRGAATPITYLLKITQNGLLSFSYSTGGAFQPVITSQSITANNGPLPASFRFGFAGSTGGSTNIHEVICFQAQPSDLSSSSAGINQQQTSKVQVGSQVYFAFYNPTNWTGQMSAQQLVADAATGIVSINPLANWDSSCVLTGVLAGNTCFTTNVSGPTAAEAATSRSILTWNGTVGVPFQYGSLSVAQQAAITQGDLTPGTPNRVNYLRGDRSNEINSVGVGLYRARADVLGDIIDSSPTWVGPPLHTYQDIWTDRLFPATPQAETAGPQYDTYKTGAAGTRLNVVYVGANDGMLHGFRAGSYDLSGNYVADATTPNDGFEVLAYMPSYVLNKIHSSSNPQIDYSNPQYGHDYYVDATPGTGDIFYSGAWHTWLVGGLGAGGNAIYALDVTNPANFAEANASRLVIGEWNPATIACVNVVCGANLGETYGSPAVRRFHNGSWGAVFGNGLNTATGAAGIYIMLINSSGVPSFYYLAATANTAGNGIAYATTADLDGDQIIDYVYAGDVKGNVWRFDVSSSNPANWAVSPGGPLFTTAANQPITTKLIVAATPATVGPSRVVVEFGTGQQIPITNTSAATYAAGTQALYGIWDWNMGSWNGKSSTQYASLPSGPNLAPASITTATLTQQTVSAAIASSSGFRSISSNPVCWVGLNNCASNTKYGWYLNLPGNQEQIIFNPVLEVGAFIVNTFLPPSNSITSCVNVAAQGWTLALNPATGGNFSQSFFAGPSGNFGGLNGSVINGVQINGVGSPSIATTVVPSTVTNGSAGTLETTLITQTSAGSSRTAPPGSPTPGCVSTGAGGTCGVNPPPTATAQRLTWTERR